MRRIALILVIGLLFIARPVSATVVGSFTGLEEDVQFDAIWVYENDDVTLILDPLTSSASLHTIFAGDSDANGCTLWITHVGSGTTSPQEYVPVGSVVLLSNIQIGVFEISMNSSTPRCHIGYNFTELGPIGSSSADSEDADEPATSDDEDTEASEPPQEVTTCTDSDGGNAKYVKGTINHSGNATFTGVPNPATDYCTATGLLREYYCTPASNGSHVSTWTCAYGCVDGHCRTEAEYQLAQQQEDTEETASIDTQYTSCADSDLGLAPHTRGSVSAEYERELTQTYTDICDGDQLTEFSCGTTYDTVVQARVYACPGGCNDGACVSNLCQDDDGGDKKYIYGRMTHDFAHLSSPVYDVCSSSTKLVEYSCSANLNNDNPSDDNWKTHTCALGCMTVNSDLGPVSRCRKLADLNPTPVISNVLSWIANLFN